jgi:hypothetical protein
MLPCDILQLILSILEWANYQDSLAFRATCRHFRDVYSTHTPAPYVRFIKNITGIAAVVADNCLDINGVGFTLPVIIPITGQVVCAYSHNGRIFVDLLLSSGNFALRVLDYIAEMQIGVTYTYVARYTERQFGVCAPTDNHAVGSMCTVFISVGIRADNTRLEFYQV